MMSAEDFSDLTKIEQRKEMSDLMGELDMTHQCRCSPIFFQ